MLIVESQIGVDYGDLETYVYLIQQKLEIKTQILIEIMKVENRINFCLDQVSLSIQESDSNIESQTYL